MAEVNSLELSLTLWRAGTPDLAVCMVRGRDVEGTVPTDVTLRAPAAPDSELQPSLRARHVGRVFHNGHLPHAPSRGDTPRTTEKQVESLIFYPLLISRADT